MLYLSEYVEQVKPEHLTTLDKEWFEDIKEELQNQKNGKLSELGEIQKIKETKSLSLEEANDENKLENELELINTKQELIDGCIDEIESFINMLKGI